MSSLPEASEPDLFEPSLNVNRELSWLSFNERVLDQARDARWPLLERLKFLAIHGANLDEFYMIRVSGLHEQLDAAVSTKQADGIEVRELLMQIRKLDTLSLNLLNNALVFHFLLFKRSHKLLLFTCCRTLGNRTRTRDSHAALGAVIRCITSSRLKLDGFWRGGNSLKLDNHCATSAWAGTITNIRSAIHLR